MPIRLICRCKRFLILPDKYAGRRVACPDCAAMLRIPTPGEDEGLMRWLCECGQRLKARPRMAGRKVLCPRCKMRTQVPVPSAVDTFVEEAFSPDPDSDMVRLDSPADALAPPQGTESSAVLRTMDPSADDATAHEDDSDSTVIEEDDDESGSGLLSAGASSPRMS